MKWETAEKMALGLYDLKLYDYGNYTRNPSPFYCRSSFKIKKKQLLGRRSIFLQLLWLEIKVNINFTMMTYVLRSEKAGHRLATSCKILVPCPKFSVSGPAMDQGNLYVLEIVLWPMACCYLRPIITVNASKVYKNYCLQCVYLKLVIAKWFAQLVECCLSQMVRCSCLLMVHRGQWTDTLISKSRAQSLWCCGLLPFLLYHCCLEMFAVVAKLIWNELNVN